ncbi:MAG: hypothetical protein QOE57_474 [Acidimicrobiaceae bacterium]|jgi:hypothetical protein|nr:hypothetical protein [Acidimicrobiaceae bacterium]
MNAVTKTNVLYIGGTGRSGSTVLAGAVGRYQSLVPVGELRYLWDRGLRQNQLCGCREPFRECPFWSDVIADAFGGFAAVDRVDAVGWLEDLDRLRFIPLLAAPSAIRRGRFQRTLEAYGDAVSRLYRSIATVSGARVVIDSTKDPAYAYLLAAAGVFDMSVVHLIRDSRAVAHSWTRAHVRPEIHWRVEYMKRRSPLRTALFWDGNHVLFEMLGRRDRPRYLRLRYEDFVRLPDASAAQVAAMADRTGPGQDLVMRTDGGWPHSISGNPVRFQDGPLEIRLDNEWETNLGRRDRRVVTFVTAPLLKRYDYLGNARSA